MLIDVYDDGSEIIILPHGDKNDGENGYFATSEELEDDDCVGRDAEQYDLKTVELPLRIERGNLRFEAEVTHDR